VSFFFFTGVSVFKFSNRFSLAVALPLAMASTAFAQTSTPSVEPASESGSYTLKGDALKSGVSAGTAASYEISGTSFSGSTQSTNVILTVPVSPEAAAFKTESGLYLYPTSFAGFGSNNNLLRSSSNPISSTFVNVSPELIAELKNKGDRYTAFVSANTTRYASSSSDDFTNSEFSIAGDNYFSARARAGWSVAQVNGSDPRGSTNIALSAEPDRWHSTGVNGRLIYGAQEAPGRLEMDLGSVAKTYDNNRINTAVADLTLNSVAARVFYRLGSRSLALAEVRNAKANYTSSLSTDSNTERRYYAGLTWEASAATTGIVKVGSMTKDFDIAGKSGYSGASWEATVRWLPLSYSAIDLQSKRETVDSTGVGNYTLNTGTDLIWSHNWSRSLSSRVLLGTLNSDYSGSGRSDTANNFSVAADYAVLRWLRLGVDVATTDSQSNVASAAFKRDVIMLTLNASL
jgi:hypothetical protein